MKQFATILTYLGAAAGGAVGAMLTHQPWPTVLVCTVAGPVGVAIAQAIRKRRQKACAQ